MNSGVSSLTERKKRVLRASVLALLMFLGFAQNGKCASDEELTHASTAVQESLMVPAVVTAILACLHGCAGKLAATSTTRSAGIGYRYHIWRSQASSRPALHAGKPPGAGT